MATRPGALAGARIAGERFARSRRQQNPEGRMPLLVEAAGLLVRARDRRRARLHPDPCAGLAGGELSPLPPAGREGS